ncbi:MAG: UDP-galactopyranose mutase [bacterium]|nr:UDP-galactopyranose mutase [Candidatus Minthenecus merdequi]
MKYYDYLIVGSGLFGATFAYCARLAGKRCLVIDRRNHLGGNAYCENVGGINVHVYGPHIFHTSNRKIWDLVNTIVPFNSFINKPLATYKDKTYNLPFNMNTFRQLWNVECADEARDIINRQRQDVIEKLAGREPENLEEQALMLVGRDIYEILIKGYTEKQWGRLCSELPAFIIKRLPVRFTFDNNYFNDVYQGIPIGGYNRLIDGLLVGIETRTGVDFINHREECINLADKVVFTGQIDEYYNFRYGPLEFRSVRFENEDINISDFQGNAVINYTERDVPFTRTIEHKHFEMFGDEVQKCSHTVVSKEFSVEWMKGMEPYYPVNDAKNNNLYLKYKALADSEKNVIFGGRLAEYKYYDMAPVMERAIETFQSNL